MREPEVLETVEEQPRRRLVSVGKGDRKGRTKIREFFFRAMQRRFFPVSKPPAQSAGKLGEVD